MSSIWHEDGLLSKSDLNSHTNKQSHTSGILYGTLLSLGQPWKV